MCLLSSVFCRLLLLLKLCLCPLNLSLNSFFVSPMYVLASSLPSRVVTDALYITDFVRHFPFSGHWLAFRQLHALAGVLAFLSCCYFRELFCCARL